MNSATARPWGPLAVLVLGVVAVGVWLNLQDPLLWDEVQKWQTLIAAGIALLAAIIAWTNATRQIRNAADLERMRRARKQSALRAVLPLSLAAFSEYAEHSANSLKSLHSLCSGPVLLTTSPPVFPDIPQATIASLAEFIEYSDALDVRLFEGLLMRVQIHSARIASLASEAPKGTVTKHTIESSIKDSAIIYAAAAAAYEYGRRRSDQLPSNIPWEDVRSALRNMRIWDQDMPRLYKMIDSLENSSSKPM